MPTAELLPLDAAQQQLLALAAPLPPVDLPLADALGLVLAAAPLARHPQPPADVSAMDGWAIRFADLPGPWRIIGEAAAGAPFAGRLAPMQAVRIFTGAHVPQGADCVAVQEEMAVSGGQLRLAGAGPDAPGANIRRQAQDFAAGTPLLAPGTRVGATQLGLVAAAGLATVGVHRRPRVAILATGSELVPPGSTPGPGQVVSSNSLMLAALLRANGAAVTDLGIVADDRDALGRALGHAASACDLLVSIGGASVGDHDLVRPALADQGASIAFWRIAVRPGKPLLAGRLGAAVLLGLPGNPASAHVCAQLFALPLVRRLQGDPAPLPPTVPAICDHPLPANGPRRHFLRASVRRDGDRLVASADPRQDSSLTTVLARSPALLIRAEHAPPLPAGSPVTLLIPGNGLTCSARFF